MTWDGPPSPRQARSSIWHALCYLKQRFTTKQIAARLGVSKAEVRRLHSGRITNAAAVVWAPLLECEMRTVYAEDVEHKKQALEALTHEDQPEDPRT